MRGKAASTKEGILGKSELKKGSRRPKGLLTPLAQPPINCPECGSNKIWKDGLRYSRGDGQPIQRYLCRSCGYRFSELKVKVDVALKLGESLKPRKNNAEVGVLSRNGAVKKTSNGLSLSFREDIASHNLSTVEKGLNTLPFYNRKCRVCVSKGGTKNLVKVESRTEKRAAGATKLSDADLKGLIAQYAYWLEKEGYNNSTYLRYIQLLARNGANLLDPEDVKLVIARQPWKDGTKMLATYAYDIMAKMLKIQWTPPKYIQEEILPFVPEERELDALIAACRSKRMAMYLQALKETFADPGEILKLRWIDIDPTNNTITINNPVKGHNPRQLKVSSKLVSMLNALPKTSERVFPTTYDSLASCFLSVKKRAAHLLQNPRLLAISFRTFRHWGATMTFHYTKNILLVKKLLGHKQIQSTMKYTQLVQFKDDEFEVTTASTVEEAKEILAVGFDYVAEKDGIMLFRKPKRFGV